MNFSVEMIPGLCVLLAGSMITLFSHWLCRRKSNEPQVRILGVGMAVIGAILIFIP